MIVKQLDQAIAFQAERKRQDAAKKDGPELDQKLEIPTPPGTPPSVQPPSQ
jgi:hypothetical protein